jgi:hypothetical protein
MCFSQGLINLRVESWYAKEEDAKFMMNIKKEIEDVIGFK